MPGHSELNNNYGKRSRIFLNLSILINHQFIRMFLEKKKLFSLMPEGENLRSG